jgi:hypothetical protein
LASFRATMNEEDKKALNLALTDQTTIEQLSSSGQRAREVRAKNKAVKEAMEKAKAEEAQGKAGEGTGDK